MATYIIGKRGNEMYIIRKHKVEYEDIIAGRLNTLIIKAVSYTHLTLPTN